MKLLPTLVAAVFAAASFSAMATDAATAAPAKESAQHEQHDKTCQKDAKEHKLKGAEHKAFMKDCMGKKDSTMPAKTTK